MSAKKKLRINENEIKMALNSLSFLLFLVSLNFGLCSLPKCKSPPKKIGLSKAEQKAVLDLHNEYRKKILKGKIKGLPKAKVMPKLKWSKKLEDEAERWAKLCPEFSTVSHK